MLIIFKQVITHQSHFLSSKLMENQENGISVIKFSYAYPSTWKFVVLLPIRHLELRIKYTSKTYFQKKKKKPNHLMLVPA